jgi:hypothetical protein
MSEDANSKLARSLVEIPDNRNNPIIDTFSNFPTKEVVHLIATDRMKAKNFGVPYFDDEADFLAECLRPFEDKARIYVTQAITGNNTEFGEQLGKLPDKKIKRDETQ